MRSASFLPNLMTICSASNLFGFRSLRGSTTGFVFPSFTMGSWTPASVGFRCTVGHAAESRLPELIRFLHRPAVPKQEHARLKTSILYPLTLGADQDIGQPFLKCISLIRGPVLDRYHSGVAVACAE